MRKNTSLPALFALAALFAAPWSYADDSDQGSVRSIEVDAASSLASQQADAIIVDVRTPIEYEMSHITGAVNVDVQNESFADNAIALDPGKTYIVHCTKNPVGGRSSRALQTLQDLGFKNLYSLEGGYVAWQEAELPLTDPPD